MSQIEDRPTPYLPDQTPTPNGANGFSNLPGSNLPSSLPLSQLPGLGQSPTQPQPQPSYNQSTNGINNQQHNAVVTNQQQFYPYPPQVPSHPIQTQLSPAPHSNLPGQSLSGQTPYPFGPSVPSHPQPISNVPPQQIPQQPPQHVQTPQQQYVNSNNAPVSPVSPYMHTHPQPYPQGHGSLINSAPLPHSPVHSMPPQYQYGPMYSSVPVPQGLYPGQYPTQPLSPGHVVYQGQPPNMPPNELPPNPIHVPVGQGYGLRHTIPPSQPVYRPVDVVVKQTQQGQALFAPSSQAVGPVSTSVQQEKPSLIYDGPRSPPFFIKSRLNNLVLDARGTPDTIRQGTHLCVWPKKEGDNSNQLWRWRQDGSIESFANPLLILDVETSTGNVFLNSPTGSPSQKWTVTGHKFLVNRAHNHVLDIKGEVKDKATDVIVWQHHGKKNQQWTLEYMATPFYIRCRKTSLVLDLANEATANGTKVVLAPKNEHDPDSQLWRWKGFNIENAKAGKVLDLDSRNSNVLIWRCHNGANQQWVFDGDRLVNKEDGKVLDCDNKEHPGVQPIGAKPSVNPLQFFDLVS